MYEVRRNLAEVAEASTTRLRAARLRVTCWLRAQGPLLRKALSLFCGPEWARSPVLGLGEALAA